MPHIALGNQNFIGAVVLIKVVHIGGKFSHACVIGIAKNAVKVVYTVNVYGDRHSRVTVVALSVSVFVFVGNLLGIITTLIVASGVATVCKGVFFSRNGNFKTYATKYGGFAVAVVG